MTTLRRTTFVSCRIAVVASLFSLALGASAESVTVRLINGRSGKPVKKQIVYIYLADSAEKTLITDDKGEVQFDAPPSKNFDLGAQSYMPCDVDREAKPTYTVANVMQHGVASTNRCGAAQAAATPGKLLYFVRPLSAKEWLEVN